MSCLKHVFQDMNPNVLSNHQSLNEILKSYKVSNVIFNVFKILVSLIDTINICFHKIYPSLLKFSTFRQFGDPKQNEVCKLGRQPTSNQSYAQPFYLLLKLWCEIHSNIFSFFNLNTENLKNNQRVFDTNPHVLPFLARI